MSAPEETPGIAAAPEAERDPALRSLAAALRLSFGVLKGIMLVLLAVLCLSGWFRVRQNEVAVRLHLGTIQSGPEGEYLGPGGPYFAWPAPVDEVLRIPTNEQSLRLEKEFWFHVAPEDQGKKIEELRVPDTGLVPGRDGSLLTADKNILHGRFQVFYKIEPRHAAAFVRSVDPDFGTVRSAETPDLFQHAAEGLVRRAAEEAIVLAVARSRAEDLIQKKEALIGDKPVWVYALDRAQATLDQMGSGVTLIRLSALDVTAPLAAREAFNASLRAESEKAQDVEKARQDQTRILTESADTGYRALKAALDALELALQKHDAAQAARAEQALKDLFEGRTAAEALAPLAEAEPDAAARPAWEALRKPDKVGGRAAGLIQDARSYKTRVVQDLRGETEEFEKMLKQYRVSPQLFRQRRWQEVLQRVFAGDIERFSVPKGQKEVYLELNRDPELSRQREEARYREEQRQRDEIRKRALGER